MEPFHFFNWDSYTGKLSSWLACLICIRGDESLWNKYTVFVLVIFNI